MWRVWFILFVDENNYFEINLLSVHLKFFYLTGNDKSVKLPYQLINPVSVYRVFRILINDRPKNILSSI